jgi:pimeloyl-ACP methyl ester carboxylesterase
MIDVERIRHELALPDPAGTGGPYRIGVQVVLPAPERLQTRPAVFFCLPGGGVSKRYFDLGDPDNRRFSFAQAMAERGCITVSIDPPGIGDSERPEDGYLITPDVLSTAYEGAVRAMQGELREGFAGRAPMADFTSIGVGHSMGAMAVTSAQANSALFDALLVMGSGPYGLPEHLPPALRPLAADPSMARAEIAERMRAAGLPAYVELRSSEVSRTMLGSGDPLARVALREARAVLLAVPGFFVMIPGSWAPEAARITVPLMLVFGDSDICSEPREVPKWFASANDIRLVVLAETGHNHFVHASIGLLTRQIAAWINSLFGDADVRPIRASATEMEQLKCKC